MPLDKINLQTLSEALTGVTHNVNNQLLTSQDEEYVKYGKIGLDNYVDVFSPKKDHKIRVRYNKHKNVRIKSEMVKRLELEHIEECIDSLCVLPDFGYP
jgi:hypothetical protein